MIKEKYTNYNEIQIRMIGGDEVVEFYKNNNITFDILESALLSGVTIEDLNWIKEGYSSKIASMLSFNEFVSLIVTHFK